VVARAVEEDIKLGFSKGKWKLYGSNEVKNEVIDLYKNGIVQGAKEKANELCKRRQLRSEAHHTKKSAFIDKVRNIVSTIDSGGQV